MGHTSRCNSAFQGTIPAKPRISNQGTLFSVATPSYFSSGWADQDLCQRWASVADVCLALTQRLNYISIRQSLRYIFCFWHFLTASPSNRVPPVLLCAEFPATYRKSRVLPVVWPRDLAGDPRVAEGGGCTAQLTAPLFPGRACLTLI